MRAVFLCVTALLAASASGVTAQERAAVDPIEFLGTWTGRVDGMELEFRFVVTEADGVLQVPELSVRRGTVETGYRHDRGDPFKVTVHGGTISMTLSMAGVSYMGTLSRADGRITGTFTQEGRTYPLVLERADEAVTPARRPQDPGEPFPYLAEDVTYPNPAGGHTLAGTFTLPASGGPFAAVILISGSGRHDRDGTHVGHRPFLVLADHLTRRGIAVLRYDDRGVGESTGDFSAATSRDFASDALAGVAYLKGRDDVDPGRIGLAGHSEGGLVAPMVAVESPDVSYVVLMAAPGMNGERIAHAQTELAARAGGASEEAIAETRKQQQAVFEILKSESDPERAGEAITDVVRAGLTALHQSQDETRTSDDLTRDEIVAAHVRLASDAWFRFFLTYEPTETLERVTVPVLAISGEKDLQVPHEENLREIEAALRRGGNTRYEIRTFPGLNHFFQQSETGVPSEYETIEETWSVEVMEVIADWILRTVGG